MDAIAGVTTKAIDTLKSVPTWVLVGLSASLAAIWLLPSIADALPESLRPFLPIALLVVSVLTVCNVSSLLITRSEEERRLSLAKDRERLLELYRPLEALFLTVHISVSTGTASPRLRHRIANAWDEIRSHGRRWRRVKRAWRALFDRQQSSSAEVAYGSDFPLSRVTELVRKSVRYAQPELLDLVRRADRAQYEEYGQVLLTDAEYALFEHIDREYRRLSARVG